MRPPPLPRPRRARHFASVAVARPQTLVEKVVQKYAVGLAPGRPVYAGDYVMIQPEHVMTHDNTGPVISKFSSLGATRIRSPAQPVFTLDHDVQNRAPKNLAKYAAIEAFARTHGVDFYPAGRGIGHQVLVEEGYAFPHTLTVASDSHSNMYGGVSCVGTPIVRTDAAALWATGKTWWQVPRIIRVELTGALRPGVSGKDVIVALCAAFGKDEVLNAALEFTGSGVAALSVDDRLTIANMTTEWGALAGVFPADDTLFSWYDAVLAKLDRRTFAAPGSGIPSPPPHPRINTERLAAARAAASGFAADPGAHYAARLTLDLASLVPHVSGPNSVKRATPLPALAAQRIPIQKAYIVSCTNARASDLAAAAAALGGRRVAPGVELYVAAASAPVQAEAEAAGDWDALVRAGARVLPAGCGPCIGLGVGLLQEGETGISATNRNYKGRMGHPAAQAYLASPAVVAASAVRGYICGPDEDTTSAETLRYGVVTEEGTASAPPAVEAEEEALVAGFPEVFKGPLVYVGQDNLNTDGIYPGKYTYQDDITRARQAEVVMENYDPTFAALAAQLRAALPADEGSVRHGVVLVGGYNFGTGSSREQAATALQAAGVAVVVAGSFGDIFKRNAINNGLVCVEAPALVAVLAKAWGGGALTEARGAEAELRVGSGRAVVRGLANSTEEFATARVGASVQELWMCGGLEGFVRREIGAA